MLKVRVLEIASGLDTGRCSALIVVVPPQSLRVESWTASHEECVRRRCVLMDAGKTKAFAE